MCGSKCCRLLRLEFHYSKLCLFHRDWRAFANTPWLPYKWHYQLPYLIYRWVIAIFFFIWLILTAVALGHDARFLIFLTIWSFIIFNMYLVWSATVTTYHFFKAYVFCREKHEKIHIRSTSVFYGKDHENIHIRNSSDYAIEKPKGCCGIQSNRISWYHMIQWLLFTIGLDMALGVTILFWTTIYPNDPSIPLDGGNIVVHLVNGIIALVEIWITGIPVYFLHFVFVMIFGACYATFTGIYFAANLTNPYDGERYIYPVIDYGENPGSASALVVVTVFVFVPILQLVFFLQYVCRYWLIYFVHGRRAMEVPENRDPGMNTDKLLP